MEEKAKAQRGGAWAFVRMAAALLVPAAGILCCEWIHRGGFKGLGASLSYAPAGYLLAWLLMTGVYLLACGLARRHTPAVLAVGALCCVPAAVTYFKLEFRGEPFLPWDLSQWKEAASVAGKSNLKITGPMWGSMAAFAVLAVLGWFLYEPKWKKPGVRRWQRLAKIGCGAGLIVLMCGAYLSKGLTERLGIYADMWMQNRYYRNYGVVTGFMTNLQQLNIDEPDGYGEKALGELREELAGPGAKTPFAGALADEQGEKPHIIYVMDEAFWDVTALPGVEFTEEITPNLHALRESAATGYLYSPSFGGGTCDVEFEALTGYSVEPLPMGCKPYQQHVTRPMFALPSYLKEQMGYDTLAIHCYYGKYWSRDKAYPNLGLDEFVTIRDFAAPEKVRSHFWTSGLVSDDAMADEIIRRFEQREEGRPLFMHAVTMENHSTYSAKNFAEDELVELAAVPAGLSGETVGALRDFATGVKHADAMLGKLVEYFAAVDEPVVLVFWGDHYNLVGKGYELYEKSGYIDAGDYESPNLHKMPLVVWSNRRAAPVDLGTVAAYDLSPVVLDLVGMKQPEFFKLHLRELGLMRARTLGVTVQPDESFSGEMSEEQAAAFEKRWLAQYDLMFGEEYLLR